MILTILKTNRPENQKQTQQITNSPLKPDNLREKKNTALLTRHNGYLLGGV